MTDADLDEMASLSLKKQFIPTTYFIDEEGIIRAIQNRGPKHIFREICKMIAHVPVISFAMICSRVRIRRLRISIHHPPN
jgi:hypothetical protein